jgi:hypothetical protein
LIFDSTELLASSKIAVVVLPAGRRAECSAAPGPARECGSKSETVETMLHG